MRHVLQLFRRRLRADRCPLLFKTDLGARSALDQVVDQALA
jgi:hypothetical protein